MPYARSSATAVFNVRRWALALATILALAWGNAAADSGDDYLPEEQQLYSCAKATRNLTFLELYSVEVFAPGCSEFSPLNVDALTQHPVEFHVSVHWDRGKPEQLPEVWREELLPICTQAQAQSIRGIYDATDKGDVVIIRYSPQSGVSIEYQGEVRLQDPSSEMLQALMDLWFLRSPVAQSLRESAASAAGG